MRKLLLILIVMCPCFMSGAGNDMFSPISTWENDPLFAPWSTHGKLVYQVSSLIAGRLGTYVYTDKSGSSVFLDNNLDGINYFFAAEINTKELANKFIDERLKIFLLSTMSPHGHIVDKELVAHVGSDFGPKIKLYELDPKPVIHGNSWTIEFNVITMPGGIERCRGKGRVTPFRIDSFYREIVAPRGTFDSYSETMGG